MSKVRIYGDTSGYVDIAVPAVAGTTTLNLDKIPQADITTGNIAMDTDTLFVDAANNRVGIGTATPGAKLHLDTASSGMPKIRFTHTNAGGDNFEIGTGVDGVSNGGWSIKDVDANANRFVINSTGNVGIGTTTPTHVLEIKSSGNAGQDFIKVLDSDNNQQFRIYSDSSTGEPVLRLYDTSGSAKIVLHANGTSRFEGGNVGIGCTPERDLHVKGASGDPVHFKLEGDASDYARIMFDDGTDDNIGEIRYDFGSDFMQFTTNAATRMIIDSSGSISITGGNVEPVVNISGIGYGYTHGAIALKSDTGYDARVRGQGIFLFNEENDTTWYVGTPYLNTSAGSRPFDFNFKSSTTSLSAVTAHTDNTKARIHASGVISAPSGIELGSGLDATAANTLDDYEEGTWTPIITGYSGGNTQTYAGQSGNYIKIGRQVIANFYVRLSSKGNISGNYTHIMGLPFNHTGSYAGSCIFNYVWSLNNSRDNIMMEMGGSTPDRGWITYMDGTSGSYLSTSDINNGTGFQGTIVYYTS